MQSINNINNSLVVIIKSKCVQKTISSARFFASISTARVVAVEPLLTSAACGTTAIGSFAGEVPSRAGAFCTPSFSGTN